MEDFVTYEIAVKLEEKGFNQGFLSYGCKFIYSDETVIKRISDIGAYDEDYFGCNIPCPTISQVLKWLRNEKKIFINVDVRTNLGWYYEAWNINKKLSVLGNVPFNKSESYEQAALAGIEYVIDNLI